jgi:hypothetical protein
LAGDCGGQQGVLFCEFRRPLGDGNNFRVSLLKLCGKRANVRVTIVHSLSSRGYGCGERANLLVPPEFQSNCPRFQSVCPHCHQPYDQSLSSGL